MRILQVVTLFTPEGAYGGPIRVALNQSSALRDNGHDVYIAAAYSGYREPPQTMDGVPLVLRPAQRVLPRTGFAGLTSPGLLHWARKNLRGFDVVHVHLARDLVTLPIARMALAMGLPVLCQTHGMIDPSARFLSRPLDSFLTRKVLKGSHRVFYLTDKERSALEHVAGGGVRLQHLRNGIAPQCVRQISRTSREVLFLARLHGRKRPLLFAKAAMEVERTNPDVKFTIIGPDEGEGRRVTELIRSNPSTTLTWDGAIAPSDSLTRMARAYVYVLPSVDEPYPMTVLESLSQGVPVIITKSCGLANDVKDSESGLVVDETESELIEAMRKLLDDPRLHSRMSRNAARAATELFTMDEISEQLEGSYIGALSKPTI